MSGTIVLGYDVESASENTGGFLEGAQELHQELDVPWSVYLTGQTVEKCSEDILKVVDDPLLTVCQHTYSHMLLKSIYMQPGDGQPIHEEFPNFFLRGGRLEEIRGELSRTRELIDDLLGCESCGLTAPWNYYRGLVDSPDVLEILRENGIKWVRANGRDYRDCQPTPFTEQPFFYEDQGFPEILELGIQGYQDDFYWHRFDDRRYGDSYEDYLRAMLIEVRDHDWVWNVCGHDMGTPCKRDFLESKGLWLRDLITRGQQQGIRFVSPSTIYEEMNANRTTG